MPRNSNGVYSLPAGNPVVPGTLIESTWANPTMSDLGNELTQSLPRNGSASMTGPLILFRDAQLDKEAVTFQQFTASISGQNSYMPAGTIQVFAANVVPTGWLECNGAAVSRTTYANLFATIGTVYGVGNGTTTFNLPDLRGEFIRGFDNGRSVDPSRVFGSSQTGANQAHTHTTPIHAHTFTTGGQSNSHSHGVNDPGHVHTTTFGTHGISSTAGAGLASPSWASSQGPVATNNVGTGITLGNANADHSHSGTTAGVAPTTNNEGTEARPRNVAMIYCIKAYGALQTDGLGTMAFQNADAVQITGGTAALTSGQVANAPVNPTDIVRLVDIGGTMTDIDCADQQVILLDKGNPNVPILRPQTNVPNGMVKLDAAGKIPIALLDPSGLNFEGTWDASPGLLPVGTFLDGSYYSIEVAGTLTLFHSNGTSSATSCGIGSSIVYVTDSPTLPVPNWYFLPAPTLSGASAAQVTLDPFGSITATNVQAGMEEIVLDVGVELTSLDSRVDALELAVPLKQDAATAVTLTGVQTVTNKTLTAPKLSVPQVGVSVTPANNFTLDASADDGTMKLARNSGQDILTVDAAGKTNFHVGILGFAFGSSGTGNFVKVPSWAGDWIVQWGVGTTSGGIYDFDYPTPFTSAGPFMLCSERNSSFTGVVGYLSCDSLTLARGRVVTSTGGGVPSGEKNVSWLAIGK